MFSNATLSTDFISTLPSSIKAHFGNGNAANPLQDWEETIYLTNGTSTTLKADLLTWAKAIYGIASDLGSADVGDAASAPYSSCSGSNPDYLVSATTPFYGGAIYQYGVLPTDYSNLATATTTDSLSATNSTTLYNRLGVDSTTALSEFDYENDAWYYGLFDYTGSSECCSGTTYSGVSYQVYATTANTGACQMISTGSTTIGGTAFTVFSGYCAVDYVDWGGVQPYTDYDGMVVLTFRSRGLSSKASGGPVYEITANTVSFDCSGGTYYKVLEDPFASFGINARTAAGKDYTFKTSMSVTASDYASNVFGVTPFDKKAIDVPLFVEESYPTLLKDSWRKGKVRGLQCCLTYLPSARATTNTGTIAWNMHEWLTPETPYVVSELQGSDVFRLFKFVSISDGTTANREYKISLINLSFERGEFDVLVRDFYDTDANPVVLEKYTRCSLDPTKVSFIGRKIGTATG
jgi:hypothetical protein